MQPFSVHTGKVVPLDRSNVDTDQIVPKQFLKRVGRSGFGQVLFYSWRYDAEGAPRPDFPLNGERFQGASVLVTGRNFGSGSSREHAVWALTDYGIKVVLAPSFADIFYNNCFKNGLLPVTLPEQVILGLLTRASAGPFELTVDLQQCLVTDGDGLREVFSLDSYRRHCLLHGLDDIGLTMQLESRVTAFEESRTGFPTTI